MKGWTDSSYSKLHGKCMAGQVLAVVNFMVSVGAGQVLAVVNCIVSVGLDRI